MDLETCPQKIQVFSFPIFIKRELTYVLSFLLLLLSFLILFGFITPIQPQSLLRIGFLSQIIPNNQNSASETCDYSNGRWVRDESHSSRLYTENCPFLDPGFRCHQNGRKDEDYPKWRWQPNGCILPRFNASELLERSRNGRIVFAGDSIGRNQWESLVCMLAQAVSNKSTIYEQNGNPITKHKGSLSIRFHEYNLTVEYYRVPFLVIMGHPPQNSSDRIRSVIRIDQLHWYSKQWVGADVLVFNAGHWWNQDKTVKMGYYFQEGGAVNMTMDVMEAFRRSLQTWKLWAIQNLDPQKSHIFFRSYSPVHFRQVNYKENIKDIIMWLVDCPQRSTDEGTWSEGGQCDSNMAPESNYTKLKAEPWNNQLISETIEQMKDGNRKVLLLNITYLTEFRKDGHPSIHREPGTPVPFPQDCSHWCLPGVPDTWNALLYSHLLSKGFSTKQAQTGKRGYQ